MLRGSLGHRRYSITHRAVQRLRELVSGMEMMDDESLRDQLDNSLTQAEDEGRSVRTLDAMLREPQVLVPVTEFGGDTLFAIIKEDTVVTVLPRNHGEEILQRGKALEERVASGESPAPPPVSTPPRRTLVPRRDPSAPEAMLESGLSSPSEEQPEAREMFRESSREPSAGVLILQRNAGRSSLNGQRVSAQDPAATPVPPRRRPLRSPSDKDLASRKTPPRPTDNPVAAILYDALRLAERSARVKALIRVLQEQDTSLEFLEAWDRLRIAGMPSSTTMDEFIEACRSV